jgi:hypothetical protein
VPCHIENENKTLRHDRCHCLSAFAVFLLWAVDSNSLLTLPWMDSNSLLTLPWMLTGQLLPDPFPILALLSLTTSSDHIIRHTSHHVDFALAGRPSSCPSQTFQGRSPSFAPNDLFLVHVQVQSNTELNRVKFVAHIASSPIPLAATKSRLRTHQILIRFPAMLWSHGFFNAARHVGSHGSRSSGTRDYLWASYHLTE